MSIEIIRLTDTGWDLSKSTRHSGDIDKWNVIYFLGRMNGQSTIDRIAQFKFGGDLSKTNNVIRKLRAEGIVI